MHSATRPSNRINKYIQNSTTQSRSFDSMNLKNFPDFKILSKYSNLSFCQNPITSFLSLPTLPDLISLKLDSTKITSFNGAKPQPQLISISLQSTPISMCKYFFEMCLIVFGTQIARINDKNVSYKQRKFAQENEEALYKYISTGWIITKGNQPIHLLHHQTRKRISVYTYNQKQKQNQSVNQDININQDIEIDDTNISFSKSNYTDQNSRSFSYASSFVSTSSDKCSKSTSNDNSTTELDKEACDALLQKLINLSHKWNPPPKSIPNDKEKDNFFDNNIFLLLQPSMVRNRRIVTRDQRPGNVFRPPVSFKTDSPFAKENRSLILRQKEEYELKLKRKQEQLLREQKELEYEFEEEEEEEEEIPEEERIEKEEEIKKENEDQLQSDLQEEKFKEEQVTADNFNDEIQEEEEEKEEEIQNAIESIEPLKQEEPIIKTEEESKEEKIESEKKIQFGKNQVSFNELKALHRKSLTSKQISPPLKISRRSLPHTTSERMIGHEDENNDNYPLLSESEMEVYRKRRLMSMNKFILNPSPQSHTVNEKTDTNNLNSNLASTEEKPQRHRRKTFTHSKSTKNYNKDEIINYLNNNTSDEKDNEMNDETGNVSFPKMSQILKNNPNTVSNPNMKDQNINRNKKAKLFKRRPTYSEILSNNYQQKRKMDLLAIQSNQDASNTQKPTQKFDLSKRKTSFVGINEINKFRRNESKTDTDTDNDINVDTKFETIIHKKPENHETKAEISDETKTEIKDEDKLDDTNISLDNENKEKEDFNTNENYEITDNKNETEINYDDGGEMTINELNDTDDEDKNTIEPETKNQTNADVQGMTVPDLDVIVDNNDDDDEEIYQFIHSESKIEKKKEEEENEEPDLEMLGEMLKDVEIDEDDDMNDEEANLRLAAFQECIEKHPDKEDDDDFVNEYVEQYLKTHMTK